MKTIMRLTTMGLLTLMLSGWSVSGQGQSSAPVRGNGRGPANILSDQQKEMMKQLSSVRQTFRKEFRASISQDQKDILGDPRVMPAERRKAFRASLTDQQVAMIKSHREEMKKMKEEFRATLTPEQKAALKKMNMARKMRVGPGFRNSMMEKPLVLN